MDPELEKILKATSIWYGWKGEELTLDQWVEIYAQGVHVGDTYVRKSGNMFRVSTVLLGRDEAWGRYAKPLIFETMTFANGNTEESFLNDRYFTLAEAKRGHKATVKRIRRLRVPHRQVIHKGRKP